MLFTWRAVVMAICSHHLSLMQYLILHPDNLTELRMQCQSLAAGIHISAKRNWPTTVIYPEKSRTTGTGCLRWRVTCCSWVCNGRNKTFFPSEHLLQGSVCCYLSLTEPRRSAAVIKACRLGTLPNHSGSRQTKEMLVTANTVLHALQHFIF